MTPSYTQSPRLANRVTVRRGYPDKGASNPRGARAEYQPSAELKSRQPVTPITMGMRESIMAQNWKSSL